MGVFSNRLVLCSKNIVICHPWRSVVGVVNSPASNFMGFWIFLILSIFYVWVGKSQELTSECRQWSITELCQQYTSLWSGIHGKSKLVGQLFFCWRSGHRKNQGNRDGSYISVVSNTKAKNTKVGRDRLNMEPRMKWVKKIGHLVTKEYPWKFGMKFPTVKLHTLSLAPQHLELIIKTWEG